MGFDLGRRGVAPLRPQFAAGWWLFVDGRVHFGGGYPFAMWLPGLLGTLAFCMCALSWSHRPSPHLQCR